MVCGNEDRRENRILLCFNGRVVYLSNEDLKQLNKVGEESGAHVFVKGD